MKTKVTIKSAGEEFQVDIDLGQTVAELKTEINKLKGFATDTQKLIFSGKLLKDGQVFGTIGFSDKDFLVLLASKAKPEGPPLTGTPLNGTPLNGTPLNGTPLNGTPTAIRQIQSPYQTDVLPSGPSFKGKHKEQTIDETVQSKVQIENRPQRIVSSPKAAQTVSQPQPSSSSSSSSSSSGSLSAWNAEERGAIQRLMSLGFNENQVIEAYKVAKDEKLAKYLLNTGFEGLEKQAIGKQATGEQATGEQATGEKGSPVRNFTVTEEDRHALMRIEALGFTKEKALEAYLILDKNVEHAINYLSDNPDGLGIVIKEAPSQVPNRTTSPVRETALTEEDTRALSHIEELGFTKQKALEAYLLCDKNKEYAILYLFETSDDPNSSGLVEVISDVPDQVPNRSGLVEVISDVPDQVPNNATSQILSRAPSPTVSESSDDASPLVEEVPTTTNVTPSFPLNSTATPTIANKSSYETLPGMFRPTILLFPGDLSPREIFASENEDAIRQKMDELQVAKSNLGMNGGELRNKALEELWEKADKNLWQSKIDSLVKDVNAYQEQLPTSMLHALQDLCSRKGLGTTLMSFTWAFRDSKTDRIKGGQLFTGYDAYKKKLITTDDAQPNGHEAELDTWLDHADAVLPRKPRSFVYQIPSNKDGVPILPPIDASELTAAQLAQLLDDYLFFLWKFACGGDEYVYAIPWEKLVKNPNQFFDTSLYKLPNALNAPNVMKPSHIFGLHEFFSSTPRPFQFRTQSRSALLRAQRMN